MSRAKKHVGQKAAGAAHYSRVYVLFRAAFDHARDSSIRPCPKPPSKNLAVGGSGGGGPAYGGPASGCRTRRREVGRGITEQNKKHVKNKD